MSSPYHTPMDRFPGRVGTSSPVQDSEPPMQEGVSLRHMKLKVLYTFDDENKTNCLARWPHILNIQTAFIDDFTEIGVVKLKTCIQAIVEASPELVRRLGQDYTVYAYDYSEYETPLVGQGMLSWVLASASSTPSAPAHQSRTVVTGRVCKNILGLFSNGVQETLEVKLRLVPVPTSLQSEYISSMQRYRELSKVIPHGFDAGAWTAFLKANPAITQMADKSRCQSPMASVGQRDGSALELVQQMLCEGGIAQELDKHQEASLQNINHYPSYTHRSLFMPFSRVSSPIPRLRSARGFRQPSQGALSRPPSSTSDRGFLNHHRTMSNLSQHPSMDTGYASNEDDFEEPSRKRPSTDTQYASNPDGSEGPSKKRAKVTAAEWSSKNTFGNQPDSLRVAASTAASVRVYQPKPIRPSAFGQGLLEPPPRAPTPVPNAAGLIHRRTVAQRQSSLRTESHGQNSDTSHSHTTPYDLQQDSRMVDSSMPSPEESQTGSMLNTPPGMASSPPLMMTTLPARSSPVLPVLQRNISSGFVSGTNRNRFDEENEEIHSIDVEDLENDSNYSKGVATPREGQLTKSNPHPSAQPPNKKLPNTFVKTGRAVRSASTVSNGAAASSEENQSQPPRRPSTQTKVMSLPRATKAPARGKTPVSTSGPRPGCAMERASSTASVPMHPVPASDPARPCSSSLQRSNTWSGQQVQHPASDAPTSHSSVEVTGTGNAGDITRSGSGAKRKKAIQERLATSIASGEMPPYCENCGAIETPTWRKAWVRIHSGTPELVQISNEEGGVIAWEALERDRNGTIVLFRIIKRSLLSDDAGFTEILLCNPCGLWLNKSKCMRPKEKWTKVQKEKTERQKRVYKTRKAKTNVAAGTQSAKTEGQSSTMTADESSPANTADENVEEEHDQSQPLPSQKRQRAASMQSVPTSKPSDPMSNVAATAALQRAIQSSPARFLGTQHSPIEIDEVTPKPTRRLLFPSPRAAGEVKALQDRSPNAGEPRHDPPPSADQADKENRPPPPTHDDLAVLFEDDHRPATPTRGSPADIFSSAAKALLLPPPHTPTRSPRAALGEMTPFTAHLNQLLSEANAVSPTANLDFGALPPLEGAGDGVGAGLGLGEGGFFALYEDPVDFSALMEGV